MRKLPAWLLAFALLPAAGWAEDLYRVEILVFAQPGASADQIRRFETVPVMHTASVVDFRQNFCVPARAEDAFLRRFQSETEIQECLGGYLRLNELRHALVVDRIRLEKSGQYRIIHHAAWQQPARRPREALPVRLTNGRPFVQASVDAPALDGTLRLSKVQYLQIDLDLLYHYPAAGSEGVPTSSDGLRLQVNRKLRPGDLNYMDHPLIGVLMQVTPIKEEPLALKPGRSPRSVSSAR